MSKSRRLGAVLLFITVALALARPLLPVRGGLLLPHSNPEHLGLLARGPSRVGAILSGYNSAYRAAYSYDPVEKALQAISAIDADGDGVEDALEQRIESGNITGNVSVVVFFAARPGVFGGDVQKILEGLKSVMSLFAEKGGFEFKGPWTHALVGFAVTLPAQYVIPLGAIVRSFDVNGDGQPERGVIQLERTYHVLNYWSAKQLGVRPWVWGDLGVNGSGVTIAIVDTGIDGANTAFPKGKIVWWADYTGDPNGNKHSTPYDDNAHGTHVAGTAAGQLDARDPQGRLVINFGTGDLNIGSNYEGQWISFGAPYMGYFVNTTGTIEVDFKWKPDPPSSILPSGGSIDYVGLFYCGWTPFPDCSNAEQVANISTPNSDTWYNLTYKVDDPSKFGFYKVYMHIGTSGYVAILPIMHFPVDPGDSWGYLYGMAPGAKLAGAKVLSFSGSGSTSNIVSAIDDIVGNRTNTNPPMYIISMSLGGSYDSTLDTAVTNAVESGIVVVVAAGNDGPGSGTAATGSPANNPYAVTVAAIDATGNITSYSSDGGNSNSDSLSSGDTYVKPDLAAPGGDGVLVIYSADTTWHDDLNNYQWTLFRVTEDIDWPDTVNVNTTGYDDGLGLTGTSMATPHVSGVAALVISALLQNGYSWDWSSASSALLVKNILLMSTFETYPLAREENASYSPSLDRGGKDVHEGYGALDALAAVRLALMLAKGEALVPGSEASFTLRNGELYGNVNYTAGSWEPPFGPSVYAVPLSIKSVGFKLANGSQYNVTYAVRLHPETSDPAHTDYDLYIYSLEPDKYGQPVILASSTNPAGAGDEVAYYTPGSPGTVIVVARRAMESSSGGPGVIVVGPKVEVEGYNGTGWVPGQAYAGEPLRIAGIFASGAADVTITIYDNTTGSVLDVIKVTANVTSEGYSTYNVTWNVPNDPGLDGHSLVIIVEDPGSSTASEGPAYTVASLIALPQPVPEPYYLALAALAILALALLARSRQ